MEIELHPAVFLLPGTFNVLVAPVEMLVDALNSHLDRNFTALEVRRAFTSFQLMAILEENHHSFLIIEHDPMLYEDVGEMVEYVAQGVKQTSHEATILLYAPALDTHMEKMTELADRVFCFYEMPKAPVTRGRAKTEMNMLGSQATLEVFS
jgi:DNA polymerase I